MKFLLVFTIFPLENKERDVTLFSENRDGRRKKERREKIGERERITMKERKEGDDRDKREGGRVRKKRRSERSEDKCVWSRDSLSLLTVGVLFTLKR